MDLPSAYHFDKPSLLFKALEKLALIICHGYDILPFCAKDFVVLFYYGCCVFRFLYFLSQLVQVINLDSVVNEY